MTPDEVAVLLTQCVSMDRRLRMEPDLQPNQVHGWSVILEDVPVETAARALRRYYSTERARPISPGWIRDQWQVEEDARQRSRDDAEWREDRLTHIGGAISELMGGPGTAAPAPLTEIDALRAITHWDARQAEEAKAAGHRLPARSRENLADAVAAYLRGEAIPAPVGSLGLPYWSSEQHARDEADFEQDFPGGTGTRWERDCGVKDCHCPHTECTAGWVDTETVIRYRGFNYHAVERCRHCEDAAKMRGEN